jgi:phosphoenolpyruvate synthase/pyruvate phosphate dikinase
LTAGEGNPLSHVQLLARNLGIPNVAVNETMTERLAAHDGQEIVMAVSPAGLVELSVREDRWSTVLGDGGTSGEVVIRPDLEKLDLSVNRLINLDELRADDSGRTVGPKAAKLGGLRHAFPEAVAPGVAIPFGLFKTEVLDRPYRGGPKTVFDWMVEQYRALEAMPQGSDEREQRTEAFRAELYDIIVATKPSEGFREQLRQAMQETFGESETGVFVRSDTNVEDLPGFTGAGLNLTLPNVIGFENLVTAINRVWASPFTARAFAWRQSHMESPEHVYTSILLLRSVASGQVWRTGHPGPRYRSP